MSIAAELHQAHKARLATIAVKAAEHEAKKQATLVAELKECCTPKPEPTPEPEPIDDGWVEQQITKHKPLWFSIVSEVDAPQTTIGRIQRATCDVYGITLNDLLSEHRFPDVVLPRHVSMYLAKELTTLSWPRIAHATGDRDHTTAIHAHRKIERLLKSDEKLAHRVAQIRERLA